LQLLVSLLARGKTPRKWGGGTGRSTVNNKLVLRKSCDVYKKQELMEMDRHQCTFPAMGFDFHDVQSLGRDTAVGTATRYILDGPGIESGWRRNFTHSPDRT